jgi:hypothetical protein
VEIMLPADEPVGAAETACTLTEPLLQQHHREQQQQQQQRSEAGDQLVKIPSIASRVSLPGAASRFQGMSPLLLAT